VRNHEFGSATWETPPPSVRIVVTSYRSGHPWLVRTKQVVGWSSGLLAPVAYRGEECTRFVKIRGRSAQRPCGPRRPPCDIVLMAGGPRSIQRRRGGVAASGVNFDTCPSSPASPPPRNLPQLRECGREFGWRPQDVLWHRQPVVWRVSNTGTTVLTTTVTTIARPTTVTTDPFWADRAWSRLTSADA
jgi:hypothetical protein